MMARFAQLLDQLAFTRGVNERQALLARAWAEMPDPDRGHALAVLTGDLRLPALKGAAVRDVMLSRIDPVLFGLSYDFVGDLSETVALLWPGPGAEAEGPEVPSLTEVIHSLSRPREAAMAALAQLLDRLGPVQRWAVLKLATGALRVGVTARMAKLSLALWSGQPVEAIEQVWPRVTLPYQPLFAWLEGQAPEPAAPDRPVFLPLMLAHPLEGEAWAALDPADWAAEWKWDGIRIQAASRGGHVALYSRTGEEISRSFPDLLPHIPPEVVLDGELLVQAVGPDGARRLGSFNDLQQRLGRKQPTKVQLSQAPALLRAYDLLQVGAEDLRALPFRQRRARLEALIARSGGPGLDLSPLVPVLDWRALDAERRRCGREDAGDFREGLMLKRWDSAYVTGRVTGLWWKWKRDPLVFDCVMLNAQRGHGKRSSFYSDYTFGCWDESGRLVPVGKAYSGFTDEELVRLDRWVRGHTVERFGPVRAVQPDLVLEVICDGVQASARHRSGLAMRFPRIQRIRWDKPAAEADRLETLLRLIPNRPVEDPPD